VPPPVLVKVVLWPAHKVVVPEMLTVGAGLTVTTAVEDAVAPVLSVVTTV
jgi:hypothetical protein